MRSSNLFRTLALLSLAVAGLLVLAGCASKTKLAEKWWGDPETGVVLEYRMPEGKTLSYDVLNEQIQTMEVMGASTDVTFDQHLAFTILPGGEGSDGQDLDITIDGFAMEGSSPQGDFSAAAEHLAGRSFKMAVNAKGDEAGCESAEELTYEVPQSGEQSIASQFCEFFANLPDEPVTIGDRWTSTIAIDEGNENNDVTISIETVNSLAGFETFAGHECARIETEFTGTIVGTGTQGPATFEVEGDVEGSGAWHFAYMEGILLSDFSMGTSTGNIVVQGPQGMVIPMSREFTMEARLVEMDGAPVMKQKMAKRKDAGATDPKPMKTVAMKPKMVTAGPFTVVGVRERIESTEAATPELFADLWMNRFEQHHDALLAASTDRKYYGASYPTDEGGESFYYLAGMAVEDGTEVPEGLESIVVPMADYAVFETDMDRISDTWLKIFTTWLPDSGYEHPDGSVSFEEYPPDATESSKVLICVPVVEAK